VRLDGYWTLADLTGVPDFLSKMGAFVRTTLPFLKLGGARGKLPALKPWARVVFLAYMLLAIPAMVVLLVLTIRNVRRVLMTVWSALGEQAGALALAQAGPDVSGMLGAAGLGILILISVAGLLYLLFWFGCSPAGW